MQELQPFKILYKRSHFTKPARVLLLLLLLLLSLITITTTIHCYELINTAATTNPRHGQTFIIPTPQPKPCPKRPRAKQPRGGGGVRGLLIQLQHYDAGRQEERTVSQDEALRSCDGAKRSWAEKRFSPLMEWNTSKRRCDLSFWRVSSMSSCEAS